MLKNKSDGTRRNVFAPLRVASATLPRELPTDGVTTVPSNIGGKGSQPQWQGAARESGSDAANPGNSPRQVVIDQLELAF